MLGSEALRTVQRDWFSLVGQILLENPHLLCRFTQSGLEAGDPAQYPKANEPLETACTVSLIVERCPHFDLVSLRWREYDARKRCLARCTNLRHMARELEPTHPARDEINPLYDHHAREAERHRKECHRIDQDKRFREGMEFLMREFREAKLHPRDAR